MSVVLPGTMLGWPLEGGASSGRVHEMVTVPLRSMRFSVTYDSCALRHCGATCATLARSSSTTPPGPRIIMVTAAGNMEPHVSDAIPQAPQPTALIEGEPGTGGHTAVKVMLVASERHDRHVAGS